MTLQIIGIMITIILIVFIIAQLEKRVINSEDRITKLERGENKYAKKKESKRRS